MPYDGGMTVRVLLVDDSVLTRQVLSKILDAEPDLEVCGTAANGQIALERIDRLKPDVVVLDVEMPVMNGLEALTKLRVDHPRLPVVMYSALTRPGVQTTLDALLAGATDYVMKPDGDNVSEPGARESAADQIRRMLVPKVRLYGSGSTRRPKSPAAESATADSATADSATADSATADGAASGDTAAIPVLTDAAVQAPKPGTLAKVPIEVVVVGVSTGGPQALTDLFGHLPSSLPVPVVIVQHMLPTFLPHLAFRLSSRGNLVVKLAGDCSQLDAAPAWLAPGEQHLTIARGAGGVHLKLDDSPPVNSCRPAADRLFQSAAATFGAGVLGVVMTGMGRDGAAGSEAIVRAGGRVIVQDEASSVVWGMPGTVSRAGLASGTMPPHELAAEIARQVTASRR